MKIGIGSDAGALWNGWSILLRISATMALIKIVRALRRA
jgi:hypothetical protein